MCRLVQSLQAWGTDGFPAALRSEIASLAFGVLPLGALSTTGYPVEASITATLIAVRDRGAVIQADIGVFFQEIVPGCSCGDEAEPLAAYGELSVTIDKDTAGAAFHPLDRTAES